mmetsp:Transcript_8099/g.20087  ORF Transcript_8099/g.20087 Transcript_8099/m.20087 type:complete len:154 (-) Transcript_8099:537-998(-)
MISRCPTMSMKVAQACRHGVRKGDGFNRSSRTAGRCRQRSTLRRTRGMASSGGSTYAASGSFSVPNGLVPPLKESVRVATELSSYKTSINQRRIKFMPLIPIQQLQTMQNRQRRRLFELQVMFRLPLLSDAEHRYARCTIGGANATHEILTKL